MPSVFSLDSGPGLARPSQPAGPVWEAKGTTDQVDWIHDVMDDTYTTPAPTPAPPRRRGNAWPTWAPRLRI